MELEQNPVIEKLLNYAKNKNIISWEEISAFVGEEFFKSPEMEKVFQLLTQNNIQVVESSLEEEEDDVLEEDDDIIRDDDDIPEDEKDESKTKIVNGDKESSVDDPIRLYLREIGKENLLTGDQEVELSKQMENGKNIIENVIIKSGIIIPEFFAIAQKAFTKIDLHEPGKGKKELNEEMTEKRRLKSSYSEYIKPVLPEMKQYMAQKKLLKDSGRMNEIFDDPLLKELKEKINPTLQNVTIQTEELDNFIKKFKDATKK